MHDVADLFRYYNLACAIVIAIVGTPQLRFFLNLGGRPQLVWQSIILFNLTAGWGTYESLRDDVQPGLRIYFLAIALTWTLVAVSWRPLEWLQERRAARSTATISPTTEEKR